MKEDKLFEKYSGYLDPKCLGNDRSAEITVSDLFEIMQILAAYRRAPAQGPVQP